MRPVFIHVPALAALTVAFLIAASHSALACVVCIPLPKATAADRLIRAEVVVLARANPEKPFSYRAIEVLKGVLAEPEIDLFLNSSDRQRLANNKDRTAVLVRGRFREASGSPLDQRPSAASPPASKWRSLGVATERYEALVREILANASAWRAGPRARDRRPAFFMRHLADPDRAIRNLAYLEVGRAPYDLLIKADRFVPAEQVHAFLADPQFLEWQALYILLLGVGADQTEATMIRRQMRTRVGFDQKLNLSAWATALVEVDGASSIEWLERVYFSTSSRDGDVVVEIIKALSVHGNRNDARLRARITEAYGAVLENYPSLAGWVARDLALWRDWRLAEKLDAIRARGPTLDDASVYAVDYYLGVAAYQPSN